MYIFRRLYPSFSGREYFVKVYLPVGKVTLSAFCIGYCLFAQAVDFGQLALHSVGCLCVSCILILLIGLNEEERQIVKGLLPLRKVLDRLRG